MSTLKMNSDELRNLGDRIVSNSVSFDNLIAAYKNAYERITSPEIWSGVSSDNFNQAASNFRADLEKASNLVREVGNDLIKTANDYDETVTSISSNIGTMF